MLRPGYAAVLGAAFAVTVAGHAAAQDTKYRPVGQQIPSPECLTLRGAWEGGYTPCNDATHQLWLNDLTHWRAERRIRTGYDDARYRCRRSQWAQSSFIQPQMMVQDRYFYDPVGGQIHVDRYLDDLEKRYGGIDAVLIWADLSQYGDRRPQPARHGPLHARRRGGRAADGGGLSPPRRARPVPHDDVGSGHARSRQAVARRDRRS